jgi:hypothetical protein
MTRPTLVSHVVFPSVVIPALQEAVKALRGVLMGLEAMPRDDDPRTEALAAVERNALRQIVQKYEQVVIRSATGT